MEEKCYINLMLKKLMTKIRSLVKRNKKDNWGARQVKEMAKLGGRLVL